MNMEKDLARINDVLRMVYESGPVSTNEIANKLGVKWAAVRDTLVIIELKCNRIKLCEDDDGNISVFRE